MVDQDIQHWQQANEIYADLTDLSVSEAIAQLHLLPRVDDQVKSLVLSLISAGQQSSHYFDEAADSYRRAIKHSCFEVGQQVGDYRLTQSLDQGGTADVFAAEKIESEVQKPVAIKLFNHPGYLSHLSDRFQIEQKILAGLSHPNIVKLYHGGHSPDGVPYMVMELVEGARSIDQFVADQKCSTRAIIRLIIQAARAVAYAHSNLVVHRDIKPSNILLDRQGTLKVVDFGIAKLLNQPKDPQKTTLLALTPNYAAPEQIKSESISVRTDIFSLAAVCLQLITGEPPLSQNRLLDACQNDEQHVHKLLKSAVKDTDLRKILYQAMQSDPNRRYRHMDSFADDLQAWIERRPITASRDSYVYRIRKFAQRRTALFVTSVALVLFALSSLVVFSWQYKKISVEVEKSRQFKQFLLNIFSAAKPEEAQSGAIDARILLAQAAENIDYATFDQAADKSELLDAIAQAYFQLGLYDRANDLWQKAIQQAEGDGSALLGLARIAVINGDAESAQQRLQQFQQSVQETQQAGQSADIWLIESAMVALNGETDKALSLARQAYNYFVANDFIQQQLTAALQVADLLYNASESKQAIEFLEQALKTGAQKLPPTHPRILAIKNNLLDLYNDVGASEQALAISEELTTQIESVFGERHPLLIDTYVATSGTYRVTGNMDQATEYVKKAYQLSLKVHGPQSALTARVLNSMGVMAYVRGEVDQAIEDISKAADVYSASLGENHPDTWEVKTNLAALLNMNHEFKRAIKLLKSVVKSQRQALGPDHKSTIYSQTILARLYGDVGDFDQATPLGESVLNSAKEALGEQHPLTVGSYFTLAKIYQKQDRLSDAIDLITGIMDPSKNRLTEDNERIITAYNTLGDLYMAQEDLKNALIYKEKSWQVAKNLLGDDAIRTLSQQLKYVEILQKNQQFDAAEKHLKMVQDRVQDHGMDDPGLQQMIEQLSKAQQ
ncbi:MAG: protein kinase domain-containing protein [Marinicella pacifica]